MAAALAILGHDTDQRRGAEIGAAIEIEIFDGQNTAMGRHLLERIDRRGQSLAIDGHRTEDLDRAGLATRDGSVNGATSATADQILQFMSRDVWKTHAARRVGLVMVKV